MVNISRLTALILIELAAPPADSAGGKAHKGLAGGFIGEMHHIETQIFSMNALLTCTNQSVHASLLRFRATVGSGTVSSSSSCQEQFEQWSAIVGVPDIITKLVDNIKDMREFLKYVRTLTCRLVEVVQLL